MNVKNKKEGRNVNILAKEVLLLLRKALIVQNDELRDRRSQVVKMRGRPAKPTRNKNHNENGGNAANVARLSITLEHVKLNELIDTNFIVI